jgi:hypothetical protein
MKNKVINKVDECGYISLIYYHEKMIDDAIKEVAIRYGETFRRLA